MPDWNAALYRRFEHERTRPAMDLLARVGATAPATVVDLGCGPGNSTEVLVARWPAADVVGVDNAPSMLEAARKRLPAVRFVDGDAATWQPERPRDVIFANALLQWVLDHARLYPRLIDALVPGGWLAVQVPDNHAEPSHALMREAARAIGRADVVDGAESERAPIGTFDDHWRWLAPICRGVDLWRTEYVHALDGPDAIVDWVRATGLRPFLARLSTDEQIRFLATYRDGLARAYPAHADGKVLLRFPRLFVVAQR